VVAQLFAEALVLSLIAAAIGVTIAAAVLQGVEEFQVRTQEELLFWLDLGLSPGLVAYVVGLAPLAGVIVGILPAIKATGRQVRSGVRRLPSRGSQMRGRGVLTLTAVVTLLPGSLIAQQGGTVPATTADVGFASPDPLVIPPLTGTLAIDGVVDEPAWDEIEPFPVTLHFPVFRGEQTEETELRVTYDDRYLYVSARMYDSEPDLIRLNTFYRDQYSGDDIIGIVIDSYNDYETALWFTTNPSGARTDRTISNDGQFTGGTLVLNSDWNSHWDVATSRDERGWYAEFRIPFSTLGFQTVGREVTMGLVVYRHIARKNERHTYPAMDPEWGGLAFAKPSGAQRITLRNVQQSTPVYVTPYALGGLTQTPELRTPPDVPVASWENVRDPTTEIGADLKYSPTSNLALDLTLNTDFAQVEADQQQVNLTRFPLFFPEKRQFFQERSSTFEFNTGGFTNRLFHSRQIGLHRGEIVRLYGGVRAVGRLGGTDYGFLNMQTASQGGSSGENFGVLRLRQQVLNANSTVGAMLTTRLGSNGQNNLAYGLDSQLRLIGDEYLIVKWAQTFDEAIDEENALESGLVQARWERRRDGGLSYFADFIRVGVDYTPRLGFQSRRDFTLASGQLQYKFFPEASSFRNYGAALHTAHYFRNEDGSAESRSITPQLVAETLSGTTITLSGISSFESVTDSFPIADVFVPPGEYWFHEGRLNVELPFSANFRGDYTASAGTFYDGTRVSAALDPVWNASRYLELGGGYEINRIVFSDRDQATTIQLGRLNAVIAWNTKASLSTFLQYNSSIDLTSMNVRFRYHFREGTDLWIVYNEGLNTVRANGLDPRLPLSAGRSLMVKYNHAFIW
jgi:hypothetical protein